MVGGLYAWTTQSSKPLMGMVKMAYYLWRRNLPVSNKIVYTLFLWPNNPTFKQSTPPTHKVQVWNAQYYSAA